jgi:hypothetical protein
MVTLGWERSVCGRGNHLLEHVQESFSESITGELKSPFLGSGTHAALERIILED